MLLPHASHASTRIFRPRNGIVNPWSRGASSREQMSFMARLRAPLMSACSRPLPCRFLWDSQTDHCFLKVSQTPTQPGSENERILVPRIDRRRIPWASLLPLRRCVSRFHMTREIRDGSAKHCPCVFERRMWFNGGFMGGSRQIIEVY